MSSYQWCGTQAGVDAHIRDGEQCSFCRDWVKRGKPVVTGKPAPKPKPKQSTPRVKRAYVHGGKPKPPRKIAEVANCGTIAGWRRHKDRKEEVCEPCRLEKNRYNRENYKRLQEGGEKRKTGRPSDPREHGTAKGRDQHKRNNEETCRPCKDAYNAYMRGRTAARRAEKKASE